MGMLNANHVVLGNFATCARVHRCVMRMSSADIKSLASVGVLWMCQSTCCANNPVCCSQSSAASDPGGLDSVTGITACAEGHILNNCYLAGACVMDVKVKLMAMAVWGGAAIALALFEGFGRLQLYVEWRCTQCGFPKDNCSAPGPGLLCGEGGMSTLNVNTIILLVWTGVLPTIVFREQFSQVVLQQRFLCLVVFGVLSSSC
jgi:hypothetical protein